MHLPPPLPHAPPLFPRRLQVPGRLAGLHHGGHWVSICSLCSTKPKRTEQHAAIKQCSSVMFRNKYLLSDLQLPLFLSPKHVAEIMFYTFSCQEYTFLLFQRGIEEELYVRHWRHFGE